jgi:hypothetical protein
MSTPFDPAAIIILLALALYFGPALIAWSHRDPRAGRIFFFNLLIGWTLVGWVIALAMALLPAAPPHRVAEPEPERMSCPHCAEPILPAVNVCRFCGQALRRGWAEGAQIIDLGLRRAE